MLIFVKKLYKIYNAIQNNKIVNYIFGIILISILYLVVKKLIVNQIDELENALLSPLFWYSMMFAFLSQMMNFIMWLSVVKMMFPVDIKNKKAFLLYQSSQLGKYIPGLIWPAIMLHKICKMCSVNSKAFVWSNILSFIYSIAIGLSSLLLLTLLYIFGIIHIIHRAFTTDYQWVGYIGLLVLFCGHPIILKKIYKKILKKVYKKGKKFINNSKLYIVVLLSGLFSWIFTAIHLLCLIRIVSVAYDIKTQLYTSFFILLISWLVAYIFFMIPAGIGTRDFTMATMLTYFLTSYNANLVSGMSRLIILFCDLIVGLSSYFIILIIKNKHYG